MRKIRFLSAVLLLALALTTSGCGSRDTEREEPSETNTMQTDDRKVAFVQDVYKRQVRGLPISLTVSLRLPFWWRNGTVPAISV